MKPDWDRLANEFDGSSSVLIADVDCTVEKALCSKFGVRGYPTIKYFTASTAADGDKYEGARDFASLKKFASESLGPSCSDANIDLCNDEQKDIITEGRAMSASDRAAWISEQTRQIDEAEATFKADVEKLQASYQAAMKAKDDLVNSLNTPRLSLYRSIKASGHDEL